MEQLRAAIEQGSGVTARQGVQALPLRVAAHSAHHRPGTLSAALAQVARRLHLSGRG
jgi:hypothetical protein